MTMYWVANEPPKDDREFLTGGHVWLNLERAKEFAKRNGLRVYAIKFVPVGRRK